MAIIIDENTRVVVQGLTGREGRFHALRNRAYGTNVVAGVTPGKGGSDVEGIPVFDTMIEAVDATGANASIIFVPARFTADAVYEAADSGVGVIVCITEGVPAHDEARFVNYVHRTCPDTVLIGPNCPGLISPGKSNMGIMPGEITLPATESSLGPVGLVSRSGTLTYQAVHELTQRGIGQTTCVGIGGDPVPGTGFIDCLSRFEADPDTKACVMIGEIGGSDEETAAAFIASEMTKPVVAYVAGVTAPPGKKMGHAGAIVSGSKGTAAAKIEALEKAGCRVGRNPSEIGELMAEVLKGV
jgi:succinyl-CoA synthetase alpha subunit